MIKEADVRFLTDNDMFSESDITVPWEVVMVKKYKDEGIFENEKCKLIVLDSEFRFEFKESEEELCTVHYPSVIDDIIDYSRCNENQLKTIREMCANCINQAESVGFVL